MAVHAAAPFDIKIPSEFNLVVDTNIAALTTNATVNLWLEGPAWVPGNPGYLIFSAFNNGVYSDTSAMLKKLVLPNTVTTFVQPPAYTVYNGSTIDSQERFITCQSGTAGLRLVMIANGVVTPIVSTCAGLKFYSPNDVVAKSDGTVWFTDPGFNGNTANPPQSGYQTGHWVYRFDPTNGNATCAPVITNTSISHPNGLCFSPDETRLYLADYDAHAIRVYTVSPSNTLSGGTVFATLPAGYGSPDGIRCDAYGRVYSSSGGNSGKGIFIFLPDGRQIGRIITANTVANLCFGGPDWRTLFIAAQPNILSIHLKVAGTPSLKKLRVSTTADSVTVSWPAPSTGFQLRTTTTPDSTNWPPVQTSPTVSNGLNFINFNKTNSPAFFRLCLPAN